MLAVSMPNLLTPSALVDTATKCLATANSSPSSLTSQARAVWALVMVSWVVKVLEATMNKVLSGSHSAKTWLMWAPSTLETKCIRKVGSA